MIVLCNLWKLEGQYKRKYGKFEKMIQKERNTPNFEGLDKMWNRINWIQCGTERNIPLFGGINSRKKENGKKSFKADSSEIDTKVLADSGYWKVIISCRAFSQIAGKLADPSLKLFISTLLMSRTSPFK